MDSAWDEVDPEEDFANQETSKDVRHQEKRKNLKDFPFVPKSVCEPKLPKNYGRNKSKAFKQKHNKRNRDLI
jgi:hypothetical protein